MDRLFFLIHQAFLKDADSLVPAAPSVFRPKPPGFCDEIGNKSVSVRHRKRPKLFFSQEGVAGGQPFRFFEPVFNFADSCVTVGALYLILFQYKFFAGRG